MSYGWPLVQGSMRSESGAVNLGTSTPVVNTAGVVPSFGAFTELVASTSFDASSIFLSIFLTGTGNSRQCEFDLAIGAVASEVVVLPGLMSAQRQDSRPSTWAVTIPLFIPAGSRLSIRSRATIATTAVVSCLLLASGFMSPATAVRGESIGIIGTTARGTDIDPGVVLNTKGAWSQITAATVTDYTGMLIMIGGNLQDNVDTLDALIDVGIGAAASERIIIPNIYNMVHSTLDVNAPQVLYVPMSIPAGSRLAARAQCSITTAADRILSIVITGLIY